VPTLDPNDPTASIAPALRDAEDITTLINSAPVDPAFGEVALKERYGGGVDLVLSEHAILNVSNGDRLLLLKEFHRAATDALRRLKRHADSDYGPDPKEALFPPIAEALPPFVTSSPALSLRVMHRKWEAQHESEGLSSATRSRVRPIILGFIAFLGHDDAHRITEADVERWKDHRLIVDRAAPKTVASVDLAFLRTVLNETIDGERLRPNPAREVRVKVRKAAKGRPEGFSKKTRRTLSSGLPSRLPKLPGGSRARRSTRVVGSLGYVPILAHVSAR